MLFGKTVRYEPTPIDKLWLLRAVAAEGEPRRLVAQTLVNGFVWARDERNYSGSLAEWVRSYAQPVNPRWYPDGDLFKREFLHPTDAELSRARERELVHSRKSYFPREVIDAVEYALSHPPSMPDATDYAAPWIDSSGKGYVARTAKEPNRNRFWSRPGAVGWPGYTVELITGSAVVLLLLATALAVMAVRA